MAEIPAEAAASEVVNFESVFARNLASVSDARERARHEAERVVGRILGEVLAEVVPGGGEGDHPPEEEEEGETEERVAVVREEESSAPAVEQIKSESEVDVDVDAGDINNLRLAVDELLAGIATQPVMETNSREINYFSPGATAAAPAAAADPAAAPAAAGSTGNESGGARQVATVHPMQGEEVSSSSSAAAAATSGGLRLKNFAVDPANVQFLAEAERVGGKHADRSDSDVREVVLSTWHTTEGEAAMAGTGHQGEQENVTYFEDAAKSLSYRYVLMDREGHEVT